MLRFEQYLEQFSSTVNLTDFFINLLVTAVLALVLSWFYVRFGNSLSNRRKLASVFLPLALGTMLIITIVKSSIALSLGLVGALSIVRFRAAIKDPEELTYLFLVIGLGLAAGANQPLIAIIAFTAIIFLLWLGKLVSGKTPYKNIDKLYVNVFTDTNDLKVLSNIVTEALPYVELKSMQTLANGGGMDVSFICKADDLDQIERLKNELKKLSNATVLSIVDSPDLAM